jgi:hypothetical protein
MSMDYRLKKLYEDVLQGKTTPSSNKPRTLLEAFARVYEAEEVSEPVATPAAPVPTSTPVSKVKATKAPKPPAEGTTFAEVIKGFPQPEGEYDYTSNINVTNPNDLKIVKQLFNASPKTQGGEEGSRGSGKGEVALFWLLSKKYPNVQDTRKSDQPDITIPGENPETPEKLKDIAPKGIGIEVKAYDKPILGIGRYGSDHAILRPLAIVFGLRALGNYFSSLPGSDKRNPSIMTFNEAELTESFDTFQGLVKDREKLEKIAFEQKYPPIQNLVASIDQAALDLGYNIKDESTLKDILSKTKEDLAASFLRRLCFAKIGRKPGWGGYIANITTGENKFVVTFYKASLKYFNSLPSEVILSKVKANQAQLLITPESVFHKM